MSNVEEFLKYLHGLDVELWVDGNQLHYRAPKEILTPDLFNQLREYKSEILTYLHQTQYNTNYKSIHPIPRDRDIPLSYEQQGLWNFDYLYGGNAVYNIPIILRLDGPLNRCCLRQAIKEIAQRHEILRTTFSLIEGQATQMIASVPELLLPTMNLQTLSPDEQLIEVKRLIDEEAHQIFDLARGPMWRVMLLKLNESLHLLVLVFHHILFDGWSMGVFVREMAILYTAFLEKKRPSLPELKIQYADFAHWQHQWLKSSRSETQCKYWKQLLKDAPIVLEIPTDRPRPLRQTFCGAIENFEIGPDLTQELRAYSHEAKVTLFMVLLTGFATLLYRYSNQEDIVIGSPIANRSKETQSLIGFFANVLPLRIDLSGDPTFQELLGRVRQLTLSAYEYQEVPFEQILRSVQIDRILSYSPLFQVMFDFQNAPIERRLEISDLVVTLSEIKTKTAKFDLTLTIEEAEQGRLNGILEYNTDLFDRETVNTMKSNFHTLLGNIVTGPDQRISKFSLLTKSEMRNILFNWNANEAIYSEDGCIHQIFESQVERTPEATAVEIGNVQLSYRNLNTKANQLARFLMRMGIGPETLVGVYLERSLEMIIGLLGILKAGGAYVPLDPIYPRVRLSSILNDTNMSVILTQESLTNRLPEHNAKVICIDTNWKFISKENNENLLTVVRSQNLAYVMYTSGSTGLPKGVMIEHHSVVNFAKAAIREFKLSEQDRVLQFSSLGFDTSGEEIYPCLLCGGTLVLCTEKTLKEMINSVPAFLNKCQELELTVLDLPTAYWHQMTSVLSTIEHLKIPASLRLIIIGGEKASSERLKEWYRCVGDCLRLLNTYGCTEATMITTTHDLTKIMLAQQSELSEVPIGRPIRNVQTYVLDQHLQPVPIGIYGELYIGGNGLARGYFGQEDLTRKKFIHNPFAKKTEARLYKTGDRVRYLHNGIIEYFGRFDDQVKIRGYRVEVKEIERQLLRHPYVQDVIVLAKKVKGIQNDLIAYLRLIEAKIVSKAEIPSVLRAFLRGSLPTHMIPAYFVVMDQFPLNPNGKIDKRALPHPEAITSSTYIAPRTQEEKILVNIWQEVLNLDNIGIHDNFFDLGGDSLSIMVINSKLRAVLNQEISVNKIFEYPTISSFLEQLHQESSCKQKVALTVSASVAGDAAGSESFREFLKRKTTVFNQFEHRPLLSLFEIGEIAPVDSVAIGYLSSAFPTLTGLSRKKIIRDWLNNSPTWLQVIETAWGRIGAIFLPWFDSDLYTNKQELINILVKALDIAQKIGARRAALTGLIPSATNYGWDIAKVIENYENMPMITTGHAVTISAVVLNIEKILKASRREITQERIGFVGLGSIGLSTFQLLLKCLPHAQEIILCDIYHKLEFLQKVREKAICDSGFQGDIHIVTTSRAKVPPEVYNATLIIGATNVPNVLDIKRIKPGTMIVDDSAPYCFPVQPAIERFIKQYDLLFTEGGALHAPSSVKTLTYLPSHLEHVNNAPKVIEEMCLRTDQYDIMGCVFSGLLSAQYSNLQPTLGMVSVDAASLHYRFLKRLGFVGRDLHCGSFVLQESIVAKFRSHFERI